ncbi:MAG: TlpA family protein disulfide reductase [Odoribacter splanchnicus]
MLEESGLEEHGVMAPDAFNHKFFERYGIRSIPRFLLVDPQGNVVISKARRPSDPVLKQQLTELLDAYDASKTVISGRIKDAESWMSLSKPGGWTVQMASAAVTDHAFTMPAWIETSAYYALSHGMTYYYLWLTPGARVGYDEQVPSRFSGDHADMNNLMAVLIEKYARTFIPSRNEVFDRSRGQRLRKQYDEIARTIGLSALSPDEKALCVGYWQGDFLQRCTAASFQPKYSAKRTNGRMSERLFRCYPDLDLLPTVHHPQWSIVAGVHAN